MEKAKKSFYCTTSKNTENRKNVLTLPFHQEFTPLVKLLKPLTINVAFKYNSSIKNILIKNSPPSESGVYKIPCKDCNKCYIGQTGKNLEKRKSQHKYNIRTGNESSALFVHLSTENHRIDWDNSTTIFKARSESERLIVEACLIKQMNTFNLHEGLYKIDNVLMLGIANALKKHIG